MSDNLRNMDKLFCENMFFLKSKRNSDIGGILRAKKILYIQTKNLDKHPQMLKKKDLYC